MLRKRHRPPRAHRSALHRALIASKPPPIEPTSEPDSAPQPASKAPTPARIATGVTIANVTVHVPHKRYSRSPTITWGEDG